jgi:CubicO group peptidase (beta-lactamase class C family)
VRRMTPDSPSSSTSWYLLSVLVLLAGMFAGCSSPTLTPTPEAVVPATDTPVPAADTPVPVSTPESSPYWPTDGWRTSTPEEQGINSEMLADMLSTIREGDYDIDSVSVVRNGYLVLDAYIHPFRIGSRHVIRSCTKSIVSALVGIAIADGYIEGLDQPVVDFFPERAVANLDDNKKAMTVEHLLTMTSGLNCQDSYLCGWRGLLRMRQSEDWVQFVLDLPTAEEPGTRFEYCNGASFLLSAIIQESTGVSALALAEEHLFGPLGISDVHWPSNPQGISIGYSELSMKPHDMAKIGHLYLNEGLWDGEEVVPSAWVKASTRKHVSATLQDGYGYQWWVDPSGVYMALGYGGQFILVVPEKDMVVVFTSELDEEDFYVPQGLLEDYIIPSAQSSTPLPENPEGTAMLEALVEALANP